MLLQIHEAAARIGLSAGTLLALAREVAHDGRLRSVDHLCGADQETLVTLLGWLSYDEAMLLAGSRVLLRIAIRTLARVG